MVMVNIDQSVFDERSLEERVKSVKFSKVGKYDGLDVIKREIIFALRNIGASELVLTLNPSDEEFEYVSKNFSLSMLQNLKTM
jgi:hypothetical protein